MWRAERRIGKILRELRQGHGFDLGISRSCSCSCFCSCSTAGNHCLDSLGSACAASYSSSSSAIGSRAAAFGDCIADHLRPGHSVRFIVIIGISVRVHRTLSHGA